MKVGFYQFQPVFGEKEQNLGKIEENLSKINADLVVLPELCTTGYTFLSRNEALKYAEPIPGPTTRKLEKISKDMVIIMGLVELKDDNIYNSVVALGLREPVVYQKIHLFRKEKDIFNTGRSGYTVFEYNSVRIGMMICFDWIYPEAARTLALKGADIIAHPSNLILHYCQDAMITRSIENRIFTITTNRIGNEKRGDFSYRFTGRSQIINPDGDIITRVGEEEEELRVVDINTSLARDKRTTPENDLFKDRKEEFYEL